METEKEQKYQIIDEFLEKNPKITPLKKQEIPEAKSEANKPNETDFSYLMTETLAQVYIDQKKNKKAALFLGRLFYERVGKVLQKK